MEVVSRRLVFTLPDSNGYPFRNAEIDFGLAYFLSILNYKACMGGTIDWVNIFTLDRNIVI